MRLSDDEIRAMLDRLAKPQTGQSPGPRTDERFDYAITNCQVCIQQPGDGSQLVYLCPTRNLSAGGVAILHGGFVHTGSRCVVQLISIHGSWEDVEGVVVGCHHAEGMIHEVRIRFDHRIDPGMFCRDANKTRVLLVEDDALMVKLATKYLTTLHAEVDHAGNGKEAVAKALSENYDVIIMDVEMPVMDGLEATRQLRAKGYSGLIVAATARDTPNDKQACLEAGCDQHLPKPYKKEDFGSVLEMVAQEPLFSSLADDETLAELIVAFVAELPGKARALEAAWSKKDFDELEALARMLKGAAGGYGFEPITEAAADLERDLQDQAPPEKIKADLDVTIKWCLLARCSTRSAPVLTETETEAEADKTETQPKQT